MSGKGGGKNINGVGTKKDGISQRNNANPSIPDPNSRMPNTGVELVPAPLSLNEASNFGPGGYAHHHHVKQAYNNNPGDYKAKLKKTGNPYTHTIDEKIAKRNEDVRLQQQLRAPQRELTRGKG